MSEKIQYPIGRLSGLVGKVWEVDTDTNRKEDHTHWNTTESKSTIKRTYVFKLNQLTLDFGDASLRSIVGPIIVIIVK